MMAQASKQTIGQRLAFGVHRQGGMREGALPAAALAWRTPFQWI
jgi:hypothetical protein